MKEAGAPTALANLQPNGDAIVAHLEWLAGPLRETRPDLRIEIAWGHFQEGPSSANTFRLDQIDAAAALALDLNMTGNNVYIGATLKRADAPEFKRTSREHDAVATAIAIDFDREFSEGLDKIESIASPGLVVITGRVPQARGHIWMPIVPNQDLNLLGKVQRDLVAYAGADRNALGGARLMRLAGTIAYPSVKKQERGYRVELTNGRFAAAQPSDLAAVLYALNMVKGNAGSICAAATVRPFLRTAGYLPCASQSVPIVRGSVPWEIARDLVRHLVSKGFFTSRSGIRKDDEGGS